MAYDEGLAERIRAVLQMDQTITEKKMFGGLAFMSRGNMLVGILGDRLLARVGPEEHPAALMKPSASIMGFGGRSMKGYVVVDPPGTAGDADLEAWVTLCKRYVGTLPAKKPKG